MIIFKTTLGNIKIRLFEEQAPATAANFLRYAKEGFYNGTIFHRVIDNFMVQGGGMTEDMEQKSGHEPIKNEANNGLSNKVGTLAMARTMDPHSASSQFFINVKDNTFLDFRSETMDGWGYCVFGEVIEGMDVVEKIKSVKTGNHGMHSDVPLEAIKIEETEVE
ncbi:peptidylprolyl isomerase [Gayadomonas joobiniege]|uniref:peptidylprolyl isomerase n=1 Tax=Gayadomonas joobiniege TaxID=1234606 RepID=UPI00036ABAE7|nr:peptidylprolyl isomerase [Gayadomonas joobiniege]